MKKITKPQQNEEAIYYSDFSGKCFGEFYPPIKLKIEFGYGSIYDGSDLEFDLNDEDIESILQILKDKLNQETKNNFKKISKKLDKDYYNNVQAREWANCDYICNNKDLLKKLI